MSFAIDGLLKNSSGLFSSSYSPYAFRKTIDPQGTFSNSLSLEKLGDATNSNRLEPTTVEDKKNEVQDRVSNSLLTASQEINKRASILQNISSTIDKLGSLTTEANNETDPTRKALLTSEADTLLSDLNTFLTDRFSEDQNLSSTVTLSAITDQNPDFITTSPSTTISIEGIPSISELGLDSMDFNNYDTSISLLTAASSIVSQKLSSLSSSASQIGATVDEEITKFKLEASNLANKDKEETLKDLANSVVNSINSFINNNQTSPDAVIELLNDNKETDSQNSKDTPAISERSNDKLDLDTLATYQSKATYLIPPSASTSEDSGVDVQA